MVQVTKVPTIITKVPAYLGGTHHLYAIYESWPPYLFACLFSGECFIHGSHLMFSWQLSFNGQSRGCRCQKFTIAGKTVESQSRGGDMSWPMPYEVRRNCGLSSTSIDPSCTHGSTISNTRLFLYSGSKVEHVGDDLCTTGNRSRNLCYDSWNLSHLGHLYPGTVPVMIKLDHSRSCLWV